MKTESESKRLALQTIADLERICGRPIPETTITCETCTDNDACDFAFDVYNTNGDCLAIK